LEPEIISSNQNQLMSVMGIEETTTEYKQEIQAEIPTLATLSSTTDNVVIPNAKRHDSTYSMTAYVTVYFQRQNITAGRYSTTQEKITKVSVSYQVSDSNTWFTNAYVGYLSKGHQLLNNGNFTYNEGYDDKLITNSPRSCSYAEIVANKSVWVDKNGSTPTNRGILYGNLYNSSRNRSWLVKCPVDLNDNYAPGELN
jgi:hypothetical protein